MALAIVRLLSALACWLPTRLTYPVAAAVGHLTFVLWRPGRRRILANMRVVLGDAAPEAMVRATAARSLANYGRYVVDFLRFPLVTREQVLAVTAPDVERVQAALASRHPIVFMSLHLGNWDLAGAWIAAHRPLLVIAETIALNDFVQATRAHLGMTVWPLERLPTRILRALRAGEAVAVLIDRPEPAGVPVRFFGRETRLPRGPAQLALRTGARVIAGGVVRFGQGYVGMFEDGIEFQPTGDFEADVQALTQRIVTAMEGFIRRYPDQWFMFRAMWPTTAAHVDTHVVSTR